MSCNCKEVKKVALELKDHIPMISLGQLSAAALYWIAKNAGTDETAAANDQASK